METNLPTIAGFISTALFGLGTLPMLVKAFRTRNLASYSLGNILLSNVGNVIYSIYVFNLPPGPIWFLHSYYLLSTGVMLVWYLRYEGWPHLSWPSPDRVTTQFFSPICCPTA
jgi:uncharacterized protein with PQ loop repeat